MSRVSCPNHTHGKLSLAIALALSTPYALADDVIIVSKQDLGTLKSDNSGTSEVYALSADGKVAGGWANDDLGNVNRAVIWSGDSYATKTDLGTLRADNSGASGVRVLSADGKVAGGRAVNDQNERRATLWRLDYPTATPTTPQPTTPAVVSRIDVANTTQTINKLGADSFNLMAMQSHALDRMQYSCRVEQGFCFGTQHDFTMSKDDNHHKTRDTAIGINAGYGFGNGVSVGVSLDHSVNRKLPNSYRHTSDDVGVGAVVRYQSPNGYFGELSGAYDDYTAKISRPLLPNTELGVNEATIKGVSYGVKVGKEFGDVNHYRAYVGAKQREISRDAYTENENTAFPISYGKMEHKDTTANVGASADVKLGQKFAWVSDVMGEYRLNDDKPTYTASLTGTEKHDFGSQVTPEKWRGQVATGVRYHASPSTHLEVLPYVGVNATGNDYQGATFRVESKF